MTKPDDAQLALVDATMAGWRQGDCVLGEHWFASRARRPTRSGVEDDVVQEALVPGLVVVTQSCDVVRSAKDRPYVSVAPLVGVDAQDIELVKHGYTPHYAFVPGVASKNLVADLDRAMTVEKAVVAKWDRIAGCTTDEEVRRFSEAVARKNARFAFPNEFVKIVRKLQTRLREKHSKASPEGDALRALREIRVHAAPSWNAQEIELTFWFVCEDPALRPLVNKTVETWLSMVQESERFKMLPGIVAGTEDMTARDYIESDRLDLDHLSD